MASSLIEKSHGWFRTWFRKIWKVRGGGLYACGFAITFIILELGSLSDDVLGIGALFTGQAIEFIVGFMIDSFRNTMYSFVWPVFVLQYAPPWGAIALGIAFFGFSTYLKPLIERWLFDAEPPVDVQSTDEGKIVRHRSDD
jgi:hypothetical protein